jgi:small-conductance mechanosensitive channel
MYRFVYDDGFSIRSDLAVTAQEALDQAGIGVPFPQHDLHLVSVNPDASAQLGGGPSPPPRRGLPSSSGDEG